MQVEHEFFIGMQDIGMNNEITNKAILETFSNMGNIHGNIVNQGVKDMDTTHLSWIVLNWKLEVYKRPKICETITVRTWAQEHSNIYANRDFEVFNENNEIVAKATSKFVILNTITGRPEKLTEDVIGGYKSEPEHKNFPNYQFEKINEDELKFISKIEFKINKSMIDYNNHVHNTAYLDLAREILPEKIDKINYNNIEIAYKKEIKPHDKVIIEYAKKKDKNYVLIKNEDESILHSVIVFY